MKTQSILTLAALFVLSGLGTAARADDRQEIAALYEKLRQALLHRDAHAARVLETPDFTTMEMGKPVSGKQLEAEMKQEFAATKAVKQAKIKITKVTIQGKNAAVENDFHFTADIVDTTGQMGAKGLTHTLSMSGTNHNTLVKTAQGWRFKTFEEGTQKMSVDGKPFDMSKMAPHK